MKKVIQVATVAISLFIASAAEAIEPGGWYAGVSAGQTRGGNISTTELNDYLRGLGYSNPSSVAEKNDQFYRLFGGYQLTPNLAFEAMYADLGSFATRSIFTGGGVTANYESRGLGISAVLSLPITQELSTYGRVGVIRSTTDASFGASGNFVLLFTEGSKRKTGNHYGFGVQYDVNRNVTLRLEAERYRKLGDASTGGELETDVGSLGLIYRF